MTDIITRLLAIFKNVPNVVLEDCDGWATSAVGLHGNDADTELILLLAASIGARQVALNTAHFFMYKDGEESVDKTMLTKMYLQISADYQTSYDRQKIAVSGASFKITKRADR